MMATTPKNLEELKQSTDLKLKKACLRDVFESVVCRMSDLGIDSGSLDPKLIEIVDGRAYLPEDVVEAGGALPLYLPALKNLVIDVHAQDHVLMSPRERLQYDDFKLYLDRLITVRHLEMICVHPHFHTAAEELQFIPRARMRLFAIPENPNYIPKHPEENRKRHFPKVIDGGHQVNPSQASIDPDLMRWEKAYDVMVRETRLVNIKQSISGLSREFHQIYKDGMMRTTKRTIRYHDKEAADEVHFFCNTMKHIWKKFPKDPQGLKTYDKAKHILEATLAALHHMSPTIPIEMFRFFWRYDGYASGIISLNFFKDSRISFEGDLVFGETSEDLGETSEDLGETREED